MATQTAPSWSIRPVGERSLRAAKVHDEANIGHIIARGQAGADIVCIGHLRHFLGVHKAGDFDPARARSDCVADQCQLVSCRNQRLFVLQAVTRANLNELNGSRGGGWSHLGSYAFLYTKLQEGYSAAVRCAV